MSRKISSAFDASVCSFHPLRLKGGNQDGKHSTWDE